MNEKIVAYVDDFPLGERIRFFRKKRRLTQKNLAATIGITQGALSQIEKSQTAPSLDTIKSIAKILEVHIATLFAGDDVYVFDIKKLNRDYKDEKKLSPHVKQGLRAVIRYAEKIGIKL